MAEPSSMTESAFFILLSLTDGPQHGYAIMKAVSRLSEGRTQVSTGTLYGALKRFLEQSWIELLEDEQAEDERGRKSYRLTPTGHHIVQAEAQRLQQLAAIAQRQLGRS